MESLAPWLYSGDPDDLALWRSLYIQLHRTSLLHRTSRLHGGKPCVTRKILYKHGVQLVHELKFYCKFWVQTFNIIFFIPCGALGPLSKLYTLQHVTSPCLPGSTLASLALGGPRQGLSGSIASILPKCVPNPSPIPLHDLPFYCFLSTHLP